MNVKEVFSSDEPSQALDQFLKDRLSTVAEAVPRAYFSSAEDVSPEHQVDGPRTFSRRGILGLREHEVPLIPLYAWEESDRPSQPRAIRRRHVLAASALIGIGATIFMPFLGGDDSPQEAAVQTTVAPTMPKSIPSQTTVFVETTPVTTIDMSAIEFAPLPAENEVLVETTVATTIAQTTPAEMVIETTLPAVINPYEGVDCSEFKTTILEGGTIEQLAFHCDLTMEQLSLFNPGVDLTALQPGMTVNLWPGEVVTEVTAVPTTAATPAVSKISVKNCSEPNEVVTLSGYLPYFVYLEGLGLTKNQVNKLLFGTNFAKKFGLDLNHAVIGDEVCMPATKEAILLIYTSVAAITD